MIWLNFILVVLVTFALIVAVRILLRKAFNIEKVKKEFLSYNHINDLHKKIDWTIRVTTAIVLIIILYWITFRDYSENIFLIALIISNGISFMVKAFFEWRYTQNPKQSILTISEMFILVLVLIVIIQSDLLFS